MEKKGDNFQNNSKLLENAKNGDTEATKLIIEANLPLVTSLSKKFLNRGYEYDEIFQVGCIGLIKAVNNFDSSFQVKFSTYAVPMIIGEIRRFIRDDGIMRISRSIKTNIITIHFAKEELEAKLHREPTIEEISA